MKQFLTAALILAVAHASAKVESHWDGGRNTPVHRLAINDEFGDEIVPNGPNPLPLSTRQTCGQCHDYDAIASGFHFNMSDANTPAGRPAQPWFWIDPVSGSQIPMSLRDWPGTYTPKQLDMTHWEWVYNFGRHLPGGDIADPADIYAEGGARARWEVSGPLEINCFACHTQSAAYDHSEWVRQILRQNYRWAATGALGIGEVRGMGSRVADYWGVLRGLNLDDSVFSVPPHVKYDTRQFDSKNRLVMELGAPRDYNCLNCHSTTQAEMAHKDIDGDVHTRAGMSCTACHKNGEEHAIARGYEGEATAECDKTRATASCIGCHLGTDKFQAGRHGAPAPKHVGIPLIHFENLTCTACHSGTTANGEVAQVRTSRANRMGVYGRARWATAQPYILEPVFVRNDAGKIEPRRMVWPAFWGTKDGDTIKPLQPEVVQEACDLLLNVRHQAGMMLATLATNPNAHGVPTLVHSGKYYQSDADGYAKLLSDKTLAEQSLTDGLYYQTPSNLVTIVPAYDPKADRDKMSDEEVFAYFDNEKRLEDLLQTLDVSPYAETNGFGAVVYGENLYYRGGAGEAVISTNLPSAMEIPQMGWYQDGEFTPLLTKYVLDNVNELGDSDCTLTETMLTACLEQLQQGKHPNAVYVAHGQVWELTNSGNETQLSAKADAVAEAVSWSVGHDVRPARMARGASPAKCADCHTVDSPFLFAKINTTGPLLTARTLVKAQHEFMELSGSFNKVFGTTFLMRPLFKIFLWAVLAIVLLVAVAFTAAAVPVLLSKGGIPYGQPSEAMMLLVDKGAAAAMILSSVYLGLSGVAGWFLHLMTGYVLVFHMVAGGLFAVCLLALIWLRGGQRITNTRRNMWWMIVMIFGGLVLFTAVAPMMTWFGEEWQGIMLWCHRLSGVAFLAVAAWMLLTSARKE